MTIFKYLSSLILIFSLAGCANKPPTCTDPSTLDLVKQIYFDNIAKAIIALGGDPNEIMPIIKNKVEMSVSNIRTNSFEEQANKFFCTSEIIINIKQSEQTSQALNNLKMAQNAEHSSNPFIANELQLFAVQVIANKLGLKEIPDLTGVEIGNGTLRGTIEYASTVAEDPKEGSRQYVEVQGIIPFVNSVVALTTSGAFKDENKVAQQQAQVPPTPAPAQAPSNIDACVEHRANEYRKENGEDALIKYDIIQEWESECKNNTN